MKQQIVAVFFAIAIFMLGTPVDADAHGRGKYKRGYRAGYRAGVRHSHSPRYYAPRPVYRGHRYAQPPGRALGYRTRVAPAPVRVWIPAQRVWGPGGMQWRRGYYIWR